MAQKFDFSQRKKVKFPPPKDGKKVFKRLITYVKPYWLALLIGILANIVYSSTNAYFVHLLQPILDKGFIDRDQAFLVWLPVLVLGLFGIRGASNIIGSYAMGLVSTNLVGVLRREIFKHFLRLPSRYYDKNSSGELLSKIIYNVAQVTNAGTDAVITIVQSLFLVIGLVVVMFTVSWELTLLFLTAAPIVAFIISYTNKRARRLSTHVQESMGDIAGVSQETLDGYKVVRMFGGQEYETKKFVSATIKSCHRQMKIVVTKAVTVTSVQLAMIIILAITLSLATSDFGSSIVSAGGFISMISAMMALLQPMKNLTKVTATIQQGLAGAESIFEILDEEIEKDQGTVELQRVKGRIEFNNVSFTYRQDTDKKILNNISFVIEPGQTVALVGRSGSGKTTLANLLPRFYDLLDGEILIDGINIFDIKLEHLRKQISLVSQHVTLFNDTIAHNIAYGSLENATESSIIEAADAAHAMEFIRLQPEGLQTVVGEDGVLLSGGQRQRLAIARALLKDAPILILDEATSALDTEVERHIQMALEKLMQGRTTLVIAHRLSTIEKADKIIVLDQGEIIETGTHAELLTQDGHYAKLYNMQFREDTTDMVDAVVMDKTLA